MPKIIKDVEVSVFNAVMTVMTSDGIDQLTMKQIAKTSGIAVGTLYNYFPDREELISKAIQYSWNQSFESLDEILDQETDNLTKWTAFHDNLYLEIIKRKAIGHELLRQHVITDEVRKEILSGLYKRYAFLFDGLEEYQEKPFSEKNKQRIEETLISTVLRLALSFPEDGEDNREYLSQLSVLILNIK